MKPEIIDDFSWSKDQTYILKNDFKICSPYFFDKMDADFQKKKI